MLKTCFSRSFEVLGQTKVWRKQSRHGERWMHYHKQTGPAKEEHGNKYWYYHGRLHRNKGPAVELNNGMTYYYHHGDLIKSL